MPRLRSALALKVPDGEVTRRVGPNLAGGALVSLLPFAAPKTPSPLRRCRILCQAFRWEEVFGWVIADAMAYGHPVIGTRVGGIPEVVSDRESGFLIDRGDAKALVAHRTPRASHAGRGPGPGAGGGMMTVTRGVPDTGTGTPHAQLQRHRALGLPCLHGVTLLVNS
jgi:Glycosyl transferases group 1